MKPEIRPLIFMDAYKILVKFYLEDGQDVEPETWFRVFNTWIPEVKDEVLVDVADYSHVHAGPVTLLVGHEANYSIDNTDQRPGLLYERKQPLAGDFSENAQAVFAAALKACSKLEQDALLAGRVKFRADEVLLIVNDRLQAPNTEETLAAVRTDLEAALAVLFAGAEFAIEHHSDPKQRFSLQIRCKSEQGVASLLKNLDDNS